MLFSARLKQFLQPLIHQVVRMTRKNNLVIYSDELIRRIAVQLFLRGTAPWTGLEARRLTAVAHLFLNIETPLNDFRILVGAVYRVGRYVDSTKFLKQIVAPDYKTIELAVTEYLGDGIDEELFTLFFKKLKEKIASYSFDVYNLTDWIEVSNKIFQDISFGHPEPDLMSKLKLADTINTFLDNRAYELANHAAEKQGITETEIIFCLKSAIADVKSVHSERKFNDESLVNSFGNDNQTYIEEIISLCNSRSASDIRDTFSQLPSIVAKITMRRWHDIEKDPIAKKLWTKLIQGASGDLREMKVVSQGIHYRLLYNADKKINHPFLAFGLRRDLNDLIEKSKNLLSMKP